MVSPKPLQQGDLPIARYNLGLDVSQRRMGLFRRTIVRRSNGIRKAAQQGDLAKAQYDLGLYVLQTALVVEKDYREAVKWWTKAAQQGDLPAHSTTLARCITTAMGLFRRTIVRRSNGTKKPHNREMPAAQNNLGSMYEKGQLALKHDYREAHQMVQKSRTTRTCRPPSITLAVMYENGSGVVQDYREARQMVDKKARTTGKCQRTVLPWLQVLQRRGRCSRIIAMAHKWWNIAAAQGDEDARKGA